MGLEWKYMGSKLGLDYHSFGAACWCQIVRFLVLDFIFSGPSGVRQGYMT